MRPLLLAPVLAAALAIATPAAAHGPTPKRLNHDVVLAASPESIWAIVSTLDSVADWHPDVSASPVEGGRMRGATRTLTLEGGNLGERIDDIDDEAMKLTWRLSDENPEAIPVSFYQSSIDIEPEGTGSRILWTSNFYRADTGNYPEEGRDDDAAIAAMEAFIEHGLAGLKDIAAGM